MISSNRNVTSSSQARGVPSFAFESHLHRFYNPHDAKLVNGGDEILLIDDGNTRPNCTAVGSDTNCFSRALE